MTNVVNLHDVAKAWRRARRIYVVYTALDQYFKLGAGPCKDLDSPIDRADPEAIERITRWISEVDLRCSASQLRQLFQSRPLATEENLRTLLRHYLDKAEHSASDREKTDFLLVHYFSFCAPVALQEAEPSLEDFAEVLEPVLGEASTVYPAWLEGLQQLNAELHECATLQDLVKNDAIERARIIKREAGEKYFASSALLAFAHYNFHARRTFFRLLHSDLIFIRAALVQLEQRGITEFDCGAGGMSQREPLESVKRVVREWKRVFEGDYSQGYNFLAIAGLRVAVTDAMQVPSKPAARQAKSAECERTASESAVSSTPPVLSIDAAVLKTSAELEKRREELRNKNLAIAKVCFNGLELILASWEVSAFLDESTPDARALQRAVAARAVLAKNRGTTDFEKSLSDAKVEVAQLQELVAQARERKDIDSAVNLAATGKRLSGLVEQLATLQAAGGR